MKRDPGNTNKLRKDKKYTYCEIYIRENGMLTVTPLTTFHTPLVHALSAREAEIPAEYCG